MSSTRVAQIVRRFGQVGGMESYVWQLSHHLVRQGVQVTVICEEVLDQPTENIKLCVVKKSSSKPRWLALLKFSDQVKKCVNFECSTYDVIHSHERTSIHHVTTFHGPPFARINDYPIWRRFSLRVWMHLWLERRELLGQHVRWVIPNSRLIAVDLQKFYPAVKQKLTAPIPPGVKLGAPFRTSRQVPRDGGVVGFVGKEWKRKGLEFAFKVFKLLRHRRPHSKFVIIGPEKVAVSDLSEASEGAIQVLGWKEAAPYYKDMDLLLHPAKQEPFGMVVIEAMASRVPVVISDVCGAADCVTPEHGEVLALDLGIQAWVDACERQLNRTHEPPGYTRGWDQVAKEYLKVYSSLGITERS